MLPICGKSDTPPCEVVCWGSSKLVGSGGPSSSAIPAVGPVGAFGEPFVACPIVSSIDGPFCSIGPSIGPLDPWSTGPSSWSFKSISPTARAVARSRENQSSVCTKR